MPQSGSPASEKAPSTHPRGCPLFSNGIIATIRYDMGHYLSESTIKQHLRAAYKLLGVSNRTEAANLFRRGD